MTELAHLLADLSKVPVVDPQLTQLLVEEIRQANVDAGDKEQAFPTAFRHSDAGSCSRRLGFKALGVPTSNPFDLGSTWVAWVGTMVHEYWQAAVVKKYGDAAVAEVGVSSDIASGHLDLLLQLPDQRITYELKSVNGFKYSKAIGVNKQRFTRMDPDGPSESHIIQTALNAQASESDLMVIGYLAMESLSIKCAEVAGFSDLDRILSEWTYTPDQFILIAEAEKARMRGVLAKVESGTLPAGDAMEKGKTFLIDPNASRPYWSCSYCSHGDVCRRMDTGDLTYADKAELLDTIGAL